MQDWCYSARSVDAYDQSLQGSHSRGNGGVAIIWNSRINHFATKLDEGNERILPVLFKIPNNRPIYLICCYLPSGTSKAAIESYANDIAVIEELAYKYADYNLIIAGDMNADIFHRQNRKEQMLGQMIKTHNLTNLNARCQSRPTYENIALSHSSHLDYFLINANGEGTDTWVTSKDSTEGSQNTSTHNPIATQIILKGDWKPHPKNGPAKPSGKIKWKDTNIEVYQDTLEENLADIDFSLIETDEALKTFTTAMNLAAEVASTKPVTRSGKQRTGSRRKQPWSSAIKEASKESKKLFWIWKQSGKPPKTHEATKQMIQAKRALRSEQRKEEARKRTNFITEVMQASSRDSKLFHQLIQRNRGSTGADLMLRKGDILITDAAAQRELWAEYFEKLSSTDPTDDEDIEATTLEPIRWFNKTFPGEVIQFTCSEVEESIGKLNPNKAADIDNIMAEHLLHATTPAKEVLTDIINRTLVERKIPTSCKSGFKIPLPKKGKDSQLQSNYRGITITALIGKIIEHLIQSSSNPILQPDCSELQFGFTEGLSPSMATLCLYESLATAKTEKTELYITSLDAQKAFDVVSHPHLKKKLHQAGIQGNLWALIDDLYSEASEVVRWKGEFSRSFSVHKGVRQGAVMSTTLYKLYINQLLSDLRNANMGFHIGCIYMGSPTCADDQLLISTEQPEMQAMINYCHSYSKEHLYNLHPEKSSVTPFLSKSPGKVWKLGEDCMTVATSFTHLGLTWEAGKMTPDVDSRIKLARNTMYALLGTGLHGQNGLSPAVSIHILRIYIYPRLLYGLEATVLNTTQRDALDNFHKNILRMLQGLPKWTANEAIYLLLGEVPIQAELDIRILSLFGAITRAEENVTLQQLARRQLAMDNKWSWFQQVTKLCQKYDININSAVGAPWRKKAWKQYIKDAVKQYWQMKILEGASTKTSLKRLDTNNLLRGSPHQIWSTCKKNPRMVQAATTRARLITNTYLLQTKISQFNKSEDLCQLCHSEAEDTEHFLLKCPALEHLRTTRLIRIKQAGFQKLNVTNPSLPAILNGPDVEGKDSEEVNRQISQMCHRLHTYRINKLNVSKDTKKT